jgi:uncharacterized membrane protein
MMNWLERYRLKLYIHNSIWIFPSLSIIVALLVAALLTRIESAFGWRMNLSQETARVVMSTVAASLFTLVVVGSSAVLLVVQLASAQLTPRVIALVYRNTARKLCLSAFVFTFTFSVAALVRIENSVPYLTSYLAAYGFLANLALFLFFIDSIGKTVRPSSALQVVAFAGREVIRSVYPLRLDDRVPNALEPAEGFQDEHERVVINKVDGVVLSFDLKGLVSLAERSNCLLELIPQVGDYVASGDPLFRIFNGGENIRDDSFHKAVAISQERNLDQDPMFAFRIIVDIASKALSPAINDPTTAVLAIDQIHHLLRDVGSRSLAEGREVDRKGKLRLMYRTPNWEDFVHLAVTEIRQYGRDSIQIMRRLRAMLENLIETLPDRRAPLLRQQLKLLSESSKRSFLDADDFTLAEEGDLQGMGGGGKEASYEESKVSELTTSHLTAARHSATDRS